MCTSENNDTNVHADMSCRPLSAAFVPHEVIDNNAGESLLFARFCAQRTLLLRRESTYNGSPQGDPLTFCDKIVEGRSALRRLRTYGVRIPTFSYVIAESKESTQPCLYTIIEYVQGKNISDMDPVTPAIVDEVENVFVQFITYLRDARASGEPFWTDFNIHQFMYGSVASDPLPHLYLVDVEPYAGRLATVECSPEAFCVASRSYIMQLMRVFLDIEWFETTHHMKARMQKARKLLRSVVSDIPRSPVYDEFRDNLLFLLRKRRR